MSSNPAPFQLQGLLVNSNPNVNNIGYQLVTQPPIVSNNTTDPNQTQQINYGSFTQPIIQQNTLVKDSGINNDNNINTIPSLDTTIVPTPNQV